MKYSLEHTKNHFVITKFPESLVDIEELIKRDSDNYLASPFFNSQTLVIDGDGLEKLIAREQKREQNNSMDAIFVCSNLQKKHIQLIDFKFNCGNPNNIVRQELLNKVNGSKTALGVNPEIHETYYIVFREGLKAQARSRFQRMIPSINNQFVPIYIEELKNLYF
jgi:hypothetical protein